MKRLLAVLAVLLAPAAFADHVYLGTITSTGASVNNSTTATPFSIQKGIKVDVQCDAAARIETGSANTVAATSTSVKGVTAADGIYAADLRHGRAYIAILPVSGTVNCLVYDVSTNSLN